MGRCKFKVIGRQRITAHDTTVFVAVSTCVCFLIESVVELWVNGYQVYVQHTVLQFNSIATESDVEHFAAERQAWQRRGSVSSGLGKLCLYLCHHIRRKI